MPELVFPDTKYKESYLQAVKEYQKDVDNSQRLKAYSHLSIDELEKNFEKYVTDIKNEAQGIGLPAGYVPHTVYWLVEGNEYLGRVDIRHQLNDFLTKEGGHIGYDIRPTMRQKGFGSLALKQGIEKARQLGIKDILVTCDVDNVASDKIIKTNGGLLENVQDLGNGISKNRYWIKQIKSSS